MKLKRWLCLIALALVCVLLPLAITAEMGIKRPDCTCSGADSVAGHRQECAYRTYFETLYTEKTAEELARLWTQLTGDEQNFVINDLSWDLDPFKREALIRLLNGDETKPEETAPATTAPAETVPGETVPGETVPEETVPEETVPEETQKTVLSDAATGVQVSGKGLPEGVSLKVTNLAKRQLRGPVFRFDITLFDENSESWQPENKVRVKIPVKASQGEKLAIVHTHGSSTYLLDVVTVQDDGTVEFQTDGFSEFAGFTVDFHYNDVDFSIQGMTSILLSELFTAMDIPEDASKASQVTFSDPSLIEVTQQEGDWLLTSLQAFQTEETLLITFTDGHSITIDVTDDVADGTTGGDYRYQLFSSEVTYLYYSKNGGDGTAYQYVMNEKGGQVGGSTSDSMNHCATTAVASNFFLSSNTSKWYIMSTEQTGSVSQEGTGVRVYGKLTTKDRKFHFYEYDRSIFVGGVNSKDYSGTFGAYLSAVRQNCGASVSTSTVDRRVILKVEQPNGTYTTVADESGVKFPNNSSLNHNITVTLRSDMNDRYDIIANGSNVSNSGYVSHSGNVYTIQLDLQAYKATAAAGTGIASTSGSGSYKHSLTTTKPTITATVKPGYRWSGWYNGSTLVTTSQTYTFTMPMSDVTYTAVAVPIDYNISYNLNGGTVSGNPEAYNVETATFTLKNPTKTGYTFNGWTGSNGTTAQTTVTVTQGSTGDKSYTANWTAIDYTISYDLDGGTVSGNPTTYNGNTPTFTLKNPTKTGHSFLGWTGSNGTEPQTTVTITQGSTGNRSYTAKWQKQTYAVTYDANGGSGAPGKQEKQHGVSLTLSTGTPSKTGYSFQYWNGSDGKTYYPGDTYSTNAALTLTAKWNPVVYTITYNLAGGRLSESNPGSYTIESDPITLFPPTRDGYEFTGWTGSNGTTPEALVTIPTGSTGNRSYTANWMEASFTITYDLAGGTLETENPASYGVSTPSFTLHNPTKTGYSFAGWIGSNGTTAQTTVTVETGSYGNKSYTATWDPITYTVRFDGNGATSGSTADQTFRYNVSQKLNKNGYQRQYTVTYIPGDGTVDPQSVTAAATFDGWRYGEDVAGDQAMVSNLTTTNNDVVTVTAQWTLATVTLPTPQLHNHRFLGWYDAATGGNRLGGAGEVITPTENMTLYAQWQRTHVDVKASFDGGRGTAAPATQAIALGADATVTFTANSGYLLDYITVNGDRVELSSETAYTHTLTGLTEDQTLVAYTVPNAYTVTYDADGGTVAQTTQTKYYGVDLVLLTADPEKPGYRFLHWLGSDGEQYASGATYTENRELTLTAQWQVQYRYRLHFDANTADPVTSMPEDLALTAWQDGASYSYSWQAAPQRAGYRFLGWSVNADSDEAPINNAYVLSGTAADTASETLYAIWQENTATYTYQLEGSGSLSLTTETVPVKTGAASGATVNLPQGYKLVGWYDAAGNQVSTQLHFIPQQGADGLYAGGTYTARVIQKTDDLTITLTGLKTPVILTVKSSSGLEMTFVADSTVTVENVPEGTYTVEAEAWGSNVTASVTTVNGELREGDPAAFTVAVSKTSGWSVVTAWVRNFFGMNDR